MSSITKVYTKAEAMGFLIEHYGDFNPFNITTYFVFIGKDAYVLRRK